MIVRPISLDAARSFVATHHRHNKPPLRVKFNIGLFVDDVMVGVCMVGRPVSRMLDDGMTAEVVRLCVLDDAPKGACSKLYRQAWRAWKEMGGTRIVTYTLQAESGASLRGAGWTPEAMLPGRTGAAWTNRAGREDQSVVREPKVRWALELTKDCP